MTHTTNNNAKIYIYIYIYIICTPKNPGSRRLGTPLRLQRFHPSRKTPLGSNFQISRFLLRRLGVTRPVGIDLLASLEQLPASSVRRTRPVKK